MAQLTQFHNARDAKSETVTETEIVTETATETETQPPSMAGKRLRDVIFPLVYFAFG